jgi:hypothetical protein
VNPEELYAEYVEKKMDEGKEPMPFEQWSKLGGPSRKIAAMAPPQPSPNDVDDDPMDVAPPNILTVPQPEPEPEAEPDHLVFWHASRYHVEIMQAGQKVSINNSIVTIPHRQIEFTENHWTADMLDPQDREKAEWLMQCKEYRAGNIIRVDQIIHQPRVEVRTGPRTTGHNTKQTDQRPAGELSAPLI